MFKQQIEIELMEESITIEKSGHVWLDTANKTYAIGKVVSHYHEYNNTQVEIHLEGDRSLIVDCFSGLQASQLTLVLSGLWRADEPFKVIDFGIVY